MKSLLLFFITFFFTPRLFTTRSLYRHFFGHYPVLVSSTGPIMWIGLACSWIFSEFYSSNFPSWNAYPRCTPLCAPLFALFPFTPFFLFFGWWPLTAFRSFSIHFCFTRFRCSCRPCIDSFPTPFPRIWVLYRRFKILVNSLLKFPSPFLPLKIFFSFFPRRRLLLFWSSLFKNLARPKKKRVVPPPQSTPFFFPFRFFSRFFILSSCISFL